MIYILVPLSAPKKLKNEKFVASTEVVSVNTSSEVGNYFGGERVFFPEFQRKMADEAQNFIIK
jgi:hypothetical protein